MRFAQRASLVASPLLSTQDNRPTRIPNPNSGLPNNSSLVPQLSLPVHTFYRMLTLNHSSIFLSARLDSVHISNNPSRVVVCAAKGPRPRYPRVWKSKNRIGTISKSNKLVHCIKGLSNVKEEVYGTLDAFIAWELEFPLVTVKKALKTLEEEKEWKRIIQVTKWMLNKGQGRTMGSYFILLNALAQEGRVEEAEELWAQIFSENLESVPRVFFTKMISIYYNKGMHDKMFEVFADMEELGVRPNDPIVKMVGDVFQKLGMLDKYEKLKKKYPPRTWEYRYYKGRRVKVPSKQINRLEANRHTDGPVNEVKEIPGGSNEEHNTHLDDAIESNEELKTHFDAANGEESTCLNESDEEVYNLGGDSTA